jgi:DNA-repair protein XRCC1
MFQKYKSENKTTISDKEETKPIVKKPNLFKQPDDDDDDVPIKTSPKHRSSSSSSSSNNTQIAKNQILKGVIFALSGFVNPERSELRDKGLKLGAKYRPDWTDDCTHLM